MEKFEILKELLIKDRSIRRFYADKPVSEEILIDLVGLTRFCASGRNLQPLKYRIVTEKNELDEIFPLLGWAGYLKDWPGPNESERPTAYLLQCLDTSLTENCLCDEGLQLQTITLGAAALNLGCCIIKSFNPVKIKDMLGLASNLQPTYIVAIGYPKEEVVITPMTSNNIDAIKYYRDTKGIHFVPKRSLEDLIIQKNK